MRVHSTPAPEAYKAELPKDFKLPDGLEFKADDSDPIKGPVLSELRKFANENHLTQEAFSKLLSFHASVQANEDVMVKAGRAKQVEALGPAGPARITAANQWLDAMGTPGLKERLWTAQDVKDFETLILKSTSQGAGSFSPAHRDPQQGTRVSDAEYQKMSYSEKKQYSAQFSNGSGNPA